MQQPKISVKKTNEIECILEATAKNESLELQLGKDAYVGYGPYAAYGGLLIGFTVGCEERIKRKWIYLPTPSVDKGIPFGRSRISKKDDKKRRGSRF